MITLPLDIANLITQFNDDFENGRFLSTCRTARTVIRHAPRIAKFDIKAYGTRRTGDMYGRYRNIHACVGPEHVYSFWSRDTPFWDTDREYQLALYKVTPEEVWYVLDMVARIPTADVCTMKFSWNADDGLSAFTLEAALRLERLPVFPAVRRLDVELWEHFRALTRFPNVLYLKIWIEENGPVSYPPLPHLKWLHIVNEECLNWAHDLRLLTEFPIWPSVRTIRCERYIPKGYVNLLHVECPDLTVIPRELAPKLRSITTNFERIALGRGVDHPWYSLEKYGDNGKYSSGVVNLLHCTALRKFTINPTEEKDIVFVKCGPDVEITHSLGEDWVIVN